MSSRAWRPQPDDRFLFKGAYSAFDGTPLARLLDELGVTRIVLAGAATEMCVAQTAIDGAREPGCRCTVLRDACAAVDPADRADRARVPRTRHRERDPSLVESWRAGLEIRVRRHTAA